MRYIYTFFMYLLMPYLFVRLYIKACWLKSYRDRVSERFGFDRLPATQTDVWIHAVSLGESISISPLIERLLDDEKKVLVTNMTPTGAAYMMRRFDNRIIHRYIPYDLSYAMRLFFKKHRPQLGLIVETELWPQMIYHAKKAGIPLWLLNARLSVKSERSYKRIASFMRPCLNTFERVYAQSAVDGERFKRLGLCSEKLFLAGNIKFELTQATVSSIDIMNFKEKYTASRLAFLLASTHENEEDQFLSLFKIWQKKIPNLLLLIAPRHPERFDEVFRLAEDKGLTTGRRSQIDALTPYNDVIILDSLGELQSFYTCCDYAFVGGSLVERGGHNVLEPIAMKVPVLTGKSTYNFQAIIDTLSQHKAVCLVDSAEEAFIRIQQFEKNKAACQQMIMRAAEILEQNKGALDKYTQAITDRLKKFTSSLHPEKGLAV